MQFQISLREVNQNFSHYIKEVEAGNEIFVTKHGKVIAKIVPMGQRKTLDKRQTKARERALALMSQGLNLGLKGQSINRDDAHER